MIYNSASIWGRLLNKRGMTSHNSYSKKTFIPKHKKGNVLVVLTLLLSSLSSCKVLTKILKKKNVHKAENNFLVNY